MATKVGTLPKTMPSPETGETLTRGVRPFKVTEPATRRGSTSDHTAASRPPWQVIEHAESHIVNDLKVTPGRLWNSVQSSARRRLAKMKAHVGYDSYPT